MTRLLKSVLVSLLWNSIYCSPFDNGKYNPRKYKVNDDGMYYRPLSEGKYVPGDEGKYTYIYHQGLYPTDDRDYRYRHQVGPNGGFGGNGGSGGSGGNGGNGGTGPEGLNGSDGSDGPHGPEEPDTPNKIEYIGRKIYAERYPYIHKVIKALVDEYVSSDILTPDGSSNHYSKVHVNKVHADKEVAVKCQYLSPTLNDTEFVTRLPQHSQLKKGEELGSFYSFKGTKILSSVNNTKTKNKLKLEYEVFVRVVDEVTD